MTYCQFMDEMSFAHFKPGYDLSRIGYVSSSHARNQGA